MTRDEFNNLPKIERVRLFATAPRVSARTLCKLENGSFRTYWVGRLRGRNVGTSQGGFLFDTREEALESARRFREMAQTELKNLEHPRSQI